MRNFQLLAGLLATTALFSSVSAGQARAADTAAAPDVLTEVVVTATKQADTANRVPLSITAVTQSSIEEQGLKSAQDLSRVVPALQITSANTPTGESISIRGVASNTAGGAATTGVYLDDVALQRRSAAGTFSGSGAIFPQLFDLQRVEVLRGPQGTLYGGSALGGAVRFITTTPSLTTYSTSGRAEVSSTENGGVNYEFGAATGGPIIQDKLAFRLSAITRTDSGYIDHVYVNTGQNLGSNTNGVQRTAAHLSVEWKPTDRLTITPSFYYSREYHNDADSFWENVPADTIATTSYSATGAVVTSGPANYTLPGHTYGPYNFYGPYKTGVNCNIGANYANSIAPCYSTSPHVAGLMMGAVNTDYEFDAFNLHSTTAILNDRNKGSANWSFSDNTSYEGGLPFLASFPQFSALGLYQNERDDYTEELRASSKVPGRFNWVAGLFYSYQNTHAMSHDYTNLKAFALAYKGVPDTVLYGSPVADSGDVSVRNQKFKEQEVAVFGEANYFITPKLKIIAGGRLARNSIDFNSILYGSFFGYNTPTTANGGLNSGTQAENSFSPKIGLQYDITPADNVYLTASKGFRPGGVNTQSYLTKCASTFAALGITGTPLQYNSDSLWSYEAGAKLRLADRAQVNASAFYIDWTNVQVSYSLPQPCGFGFITNAGGAVSKGGDIQAQVKIFAGLSGSVQASYTDAYYTSSLVGPAPTNTVFINKGDTLPQAPVNVNLGLRYDFTAMTKYPAYMRADYQYASSYKRGFGPGTSSYNIDTYNAAATHYLSLRAAVIVRDAELALFVNNAANSQDILSRSGGRSCSNATCSVVRSYNPVFTDTTFTPRTIGVSVDFKL